MPFGGPRQGRSIANAPTGAPRNIEAVGAHYAGMFKAAGLAPMRLKNPEPGTLVFGKDRTCVVVTLRNEGPQGKMVLVRLVVTSFLELPQ